MKSSVIGAFRALAMLSVPILSVTFTACTTNVTSAPVGSSGSPGAGSTPAPTADCKSRCTAKASQCGAPAAQANEACSGICDGSYTNDQLACLESKPCAQLQGSSLAGLCPSGTGGASSGGASSGGGSTHFSCSLNGECFKCNDSTGVSKCSLTTGPGPGCTSTDPSYCEE